MPNKYRSLCLALVVLALGGGLAAQGQAQTDHTLEADRSHRDKGLAFGVQPFLAPRPQMMNGKLLYFRPDFFSQMTDPGNWHDISRLAGEYEMYIELLQGAKAFPKEVNLPALAGAFNSQKLTVTFQVGGPRPNHHACSGTGASAAQKDLDLLRTWQQAGGRIDKVITDNSFAKYYNATDPKCYTSPEQLINLVAEELSAYFTVISQAFPGIKFGVTDGFAQFRVTDDNGARDGGRLTYNATVPMPDFVFKTYLVSLTRNLRNKALSLDEFVIDCAEAYVSDASRYPTSRYIVNSRNYGRVIAGVKIMKELHVGSGIYWEVFPQRSSTATEERQYHDLGLQQIVSYYSFGERPAHNRLVFWTHIPDVTGPETAPYTALNDVRGDARELATLDSRTSR